MARSSPREWEIYGRLRLGETFNISEAACFLRKNTGRPMKGKPLAQGQAFRVWMTDSKTNEAYDDKDGV